MELWRLRFLLDAWACVPLLVDAKRGADYQARFDLLWKGDLKPQWVKWRAARVTEFFTRMVGFIHRKCPGMKVYLTIPGEGDVYEKKGIDIDALLAIKGVKSSLGREVQSYWCHRSLVGQCDEVG